MVTIKEIVSEDWKELRDLRLRAVIDSPEAFGDSFKKVKSRPEKYWIDGIENNYVLATKADSE